MMLCSIRQS